MSQNKTLEKSCADCDYWIAEPKESDRRGWGKCAIDLSAWTQPPHTCSKNTDYPLPTFEEKVLDLLTSIAESLKGIAEKLTGDVDPWLEYVRKTIDKL